jgi:hypothetical protein
MTEVGLMKREKLQQWREAQRRYRLSDRHVCMAIELQLNPNKLGHLSSNRSEPWKLPLAQFLETIYFQRVHRTAPERVVSLDSLLQKLTRPGHSPSSSADSSADQAMP